MDLVEVDPVGLQALQRGLDLAEDPAPRVAGLVWIVAHRAVELGGEHDVLAPTAASALPTISSDSPREYTSAVSMKLIPASSARWMMRIARVVVGLTPGAEHHRAEAERTDMYAGAAERSLLHVHTVATLGRSGVIPL